MSVPETAPSALTPASYNRYSRWLHWLIAGLIIFMIFLGWRLEDHDSMRLARVTLHKSVGITILLLSLVRIGVRLAYRAPAEPPVPKWQLLAAKALHLGFYVVMIGMPLTGWLMVSTSVRPIPYFGLFDWPHLPVPQTHDAHELFEAIHGLIAKAIIYLMVPLHVLAALKHQFIDKDEVLEHMVPGLKPQPIANWRWIVPLGVAGLATALGFGLYRGVPDKKEAPVTPPPTEGAAAESTAEVSASTSVAASTSASSSSVVAVTSWTVDKSASAIQFATTFEGEAIKGSFSSYASQIVFDPAQLDKSHVKVSIDLTSVSSGDSDRDATLKGGDFFNTAATPKAVFESKSFTKKDATHFVAHGKLTLRGVTKSCELPFSLVIKNGIADMSGSVDIDRTVFGVGAGEFAATDNLPAKVSVSIKLKAKAAS